MAFSLNISLVCIVLAIVFLVGLTEARDHLIGGAVDAWKVPSSDSESLSKWAQKNRFQIGDVLVWKYDSKKDSVLQVTREAYLTCNTTNPIAQHQNDATKVVLEKSGPHYFISGVKDSCDKGEKLIVVVMSKRTKPSGAAPAISPAVAPTPQSGGAEAPAVPPAAGGAVGVKAGVVGVVGVLVGFLFM